jgi:DNA-binding NtrC family response regulator
MEKSPNAFDLNATSPTNDIHNKYGGPMNLATQQVKDIARPRILIVEDDTTFEPFWQAIVEKSDRQAQIYWASSELEAERMIFEAIKSEQKFDLVITDIFLSGSRTGIDLWNKFFHKLHGRIIVTSGIEYEKFVQYFENAEMRPLYLQKPLEPAECIGAIYSALHESN